MAEMSEGVRIFRFVGGIVGGVLGAIALIHSMVYNPLKTDISQLSNKVDSRYDEQIRSNLNTTSSLARIESRLDICLPLPEKRK